MTSFSVPLDVLKRVAVNATEIRPDDRAILTAQLGRDPRGLVGIGARCACGAPAVTITYPRLPDGSPFPTVFYLSYPWLVREISRIECGRWCRTMSALRLILSMLRRMRVRTIRM